MPSALAVFFHTTQRPMPRTLAIEPTAVKASVSPDVRLARWMGFNGGIHHVGGIASILVLLAKVPYCLSASLSQSLPSFSSTVCQLNGSLLPKHYFFNNGL